MALIILGIVLAPAFAAGLGAISPYWMIASFVVAYGKAVVSVSDKQGVEDYRELEADEFMKREGDIRIVVIKYVAFIALAYGAGYLVSVYG